MTNELEDAMEAEGFDPHASLSLTDKDVVGFLRRTFDAKVSLERKVQTMREAATERARQINQLKEKLRNPDQRFADLMSERDAALAQVGVLRAFMHKVSLTMKLDDPLLQELDRALSNTSATAQEYAKELRERIIAELKASDGH